MYDRRRGDQDEAAEQEPDFEDNDAEAADYYKDQASLLGMLLLVLLSILLLVLWLLMLRVLPL